MRYSFIILFLLGLNCNNKRVIQLPEIKTSKITKILDVSPAYIFFDDTKADSTLLNRNNLIISTNWLVNVDKRLTLKQAIPHITFLQNKKRNAELHKNKDAKNYYTCNTTSIGNLGFIDFTNIFYYNTEVNAQPGTYKIIINSTENITISTANTTTANATISTIKLNIEQLLNANHNNITFLLVFNESLTFQNYITVKSIMSAFDKNTSKKEYILPKSHSLF